MKLRYIETPRPKLVIGLGSLDPKSKRWVEVAGNKFSETNIHMPESIYARRRLLERSFGRRIKCSSG